MKTQPATTLRSRPLAFALKLIGARRLALPALAAMPGLVFAELPTGGTVVGGAATIANLDANHQRITQTTDRAIVNWQTFSIDGASYVQFVQPSSSSVVLNRVVGGAPSSILGSLSANGQVFLVNPNGVYFGAGASVDVAGLVATTLDVGNADFMAGRYVFTRPDGAPARAEVINQGIINAREGGYVVLAGDYAANSGVIQARLGTVALAAGNKLTLDLAGDRLVSFAVDEQTVANLAGVANTGQLLADGGRVFMTAKVAGDLAAMVVNNTGLVQAQSTVERNGEIYLAADGGSVHNAGTLDASAQPGANGGSVSVVSHGGGDTVLAAGSLIKVSGSDLAVSNAGRVYTWADGTTRFEKGAAIEARGGAVGGDGGFIEVSGHKVVYRGFADARAPHGKRGTLLIDPNQILIAQGSGSNSPASCTIAGNNCATISEHNLELALQGGGADVVLEATGANAKITLADLSLNGGDGSLDGRNGVHTGAGLKLQVNGNASGSGTTKIEFLNPANTIAVDGDLFLGRTSAGATAPTIDVGKLIARNIAIGNSASHVGAVTVGALTAVPKDGTDTATSNIGIFATGSINLNGPISVRSNASGNSAAKLNVQTANGNIVHLAGASNAIVVGNVGDSAGAVATFTANGTIQLGEVSALSAARPASITIDGDLGVTLAGPITVQGQRGSAAFSGAYLEVRANNGDISHTGGLIRVTDNTSSGGRATACFTVGGGICGSGSVGTVGVHTITLGAVTAEAATNGGAQAHIFVNASGGIALNDNLTARGGGATIDVRANGNSSGAITLASGMTVEATATGNNVGANINVVNAGGPITLDGALKAYVTGGSSARAQVTVQGHGAVSVGEIVATAVASPSFASHRGSVDIQSNNGDVTLKGPITVTGNYGSGSDAKLNVAAGGNLLQESTAPIIVHNYGGNAAASFNAGGSADMDSVAVTASSQATINIYAATSITLRNDVIAQGNSNATIFIGGNPSSSPAPSITLNAGKTVQATATNSSGQASVEIRSQGKGAVTLDGTVGATAAGSSGGADVSVSGGTVALGAILADAGSNAHISIDGESISLGAGLAPTGANNAVTFSLTGGAGNLAGNGHLIETQSLEVSGVAGTGTIDLTANAPLITLQRGGASITVDNSAFTGALSIAAGGPGGASDAIGNLSLTTGGAATLTRLNTLGSSLIFRANGLDITDGAPSTAGGSHVTLKPFTPTNIIGVFSATDTDAVIDTNYSDTVLNAFGPGATLTIGGAFGGQQTGDIHVGADGPFNIGNKNIVFDTAGHVVTHMAPITTGTVTVVGLAAGTSATDEVTATMAAIGAGLDQASGGDAAENNEAGRSLSGLFQPGGSGTTLPPPLFEIHGGVNLGGSPNGEEDADRRNRSGT